MEPTRFVGTAPPGLLSGERMPAPYLEKASGKGNRNCARRMLRFVIPPVPRLQPMFTPVTVLRYKVLESCRVRPEP